MFSIILPVSFLIISACVVDCQACDNCYTYSVLHSSSCPDCCCSISNTKTRNCCENSSKMPQQDQESPVDEGFLYYLAAIAVLFAMTLSIVCCIRLYTDKKCVDLLVCELGARRTNIQSALYRAETNNSLTTAQENAEMSSIEIILPKCPPYVRYPPPYTEAATHIVDLPDVDFKNQLERR